ncbi:MAG: hypothetical protein J6V32_00800 [Elusimicrobiaceae bacterium]|nr:hypothetical protein [Elusimicrobiaceae bacterium]
MKRKTLVTAGVVFSALMAAALPSKAQVFGGAKNLFPSLWGKSQQVVKTAEFAREIKKIEREIDKAAKAGNFTKASASTHQLKEYLSSSVQKAEASAKAGKLAAGSMQQATKEFSKNTSETLLQLPEKTPSGARLEDFRKINSPFEKAWDELSPTEFYLLRQHANVERNVEEMGKQLHLQAVERVPQGATVVNFEKEFPPLSQDTYHFLLNEGVLKPLTEYTDTYVYFSPEEIEAFRFNERPVLISDGHVYIELPPGGQYARVSRGYVVAMGGTEQWLAQAHAFSGQIAKEKFYKHLDAEFLTVAQIDEQAAAFENHFAQTIYSQNNPGQYAQVFAAGEYTAKTDEKISSVGPKEVFVFTQAVAVPIAQHGEQIIPAGSRLVVRSAGDNSPFRAEIYSEGLFKNRFVIP